MRLLIVEDDVELSQALARGFRDEGFAVDRAFDGPEGLAYALSGEYDLIVLDLMLPGFDGFRVLEELRDEGCDSPVLFLTARDAVEDRVKGLRLGGDDYLSKPFSFEELLARVRAVLRRFSAGAAQNLLKCGKLELELESRRVTCQGTPIQLTPREFDILEALMLRKGKVLSRDRVIAHVYDGTHECDSNVIDAHVANLRRKLRKATGEGIVETVRGLGFRLPRNVE